MRKVFLFFSIILALVCRSQNAAELNIPNVLPPSPEATALNKAGQLSVGLVSGAAQASIPLHEIKLGDVTIPIALNYTTNGVKVDELPSRTGMGWTLSSSGVVSRVVHGMPDDHVTRLQPPAGFPAYSEGLFTYLHNIAGPSRPTAGQYDKEPDEFRFSAPGLSGKFILDDNGIPIEIPFSNNKIQVVGGPWGGGGPIQRNNRHQYRRSEVSLWGDRCL